MKAILKLLAPYLAVGIFCCGLSHAWLAMLAYHAQIIFWSLRSPGFWRRPTYSHTMLLALPCVLAGPLLYVLLPHITHQPLSIWLQDHQLSKMSCLALIPYFGLLHPILEQLHWSPLRKQTPLAHPMFAGYHMVVLYTLLTPPWLILCFVVLTAASAMWQKMEKQTHSLVAPVLSHILADLGIMMVAWLHVG